MAFEPNKLELRFHSVAHRKLTRLAKPGGFRINKFTGDVLVWIPQRPQLCFAKDCLCMDLVEELPVGLSWYKLSDLDGSPKRVIASKG